MSSRGQTVSIAEWLSTRSPAAPQALQQRLSELTRDASCDRSELSAVLVEIATRVFRNLDDSRSSALDLLAADALITYAMEAAADIGRGEAAKSAMLSVAGAVSR